MVIEVKTRFGDIVFGNWKTSDPNFMWCREVCNILTKEEVEDGVGIVLLKFDDCWSVRFFGGNLYYRIIESYKLMYPEGKKYLTATKAKEDIDKFLYRVNALGVFL
jgi:hypothetical protein